LSLFWGKIAERLVGGKVCEPAKGDVQTKTRRALTGGETQAGRWARCEIIQRVGVRKVDVRGGRLDGEGATKKNVSAGHDKGSGKDGRLRAFRLEISDGKSGPESCPSLILLWILERHKNFSAHRGHVSLKKKKRAAKKGGSGKRTGGPLTGWT